MCLYLSRDFHFYKKKGSVQIQKGNNNTIKHFCQKQLHLRHQVPPQLMRQLVNHFHALVTEWVRWSQLETADSLGLIKPFVFFFFSNHYVIVLSLQCWCRTLVCNCLLKWPVTYTDEHHLNMGEILTVLTIKAWIASVVSSLICKLDIILQHYFFIKPDMNYCLWRLHFVYQ